jgi:hypothetical protein
MTADKAIFSTLTHSLPPTPHTFAHFVTKSRKKPWTSTFHPHSLSQFVTVFFSLSHFVTFGNKKCLTFPRTVYCRHCHELLSPHCLRVTYFMEARVFFHLNPTITTHLHHPFVLRPILLKFWFFQALPLHSHSTFQHFNTPATHLHVWQSTHMTALTHLRVSQCENNLTFNEHLNTCGDLTTHQRQGSAEHSEVWRTGESKPI